MSHEDSLRAINDNPGSDRLFEHCSSKWTTSKNCPPVIICPLCGNAMPDLNATIKELVDWCEMLSERVKKHHNTFLE